jgi:hypothetical protein
MNKLALLVLVSFLAACGSGGSNSVATATDNASDKTVVSVDSDGNTNVNTSSLSSTLDGYAKGDISEQEQTGMLLMREEEKLAHDVYTKLYSLHNQKIFNNISDSEQTHTDAMLTLLNRYEIHDPVGTNAAGVFTDIELQMIYDNLVALGSPSLLDALYVGAQVEELDIRDIELLKDEVVENDDIIMVYDNLLKGSRNHLRSFNKQIISNGGSYEPIYISQDQYNSIVNSEMEKG